VTARLLGLNRLEEGEIIAAIDGIWDVLVTCDRGIPWQNQFGGRRIAVVMLCSRTKKLHDLVAVVPALSAALATIQPSDAREAS